MTTATLVHEFGHVFDNHYKEVKDLLASDSIPDVFMGNTNGYMCGNTSCLSHSSEHAAGNYNRAEEFANMFENWVLDGLSVDGVNYGYDDTPLGTTRDQWMNSDPVTYPGAGMGFFLGNMGLR